MNSKITTHRHIAGTPAELLALEGMYETSKAGHLLGLHVAPDNEVIIAYADDLAIALLVFTEYEELSEIWVHFGYCKPEYRRKGYYRDCISKLREIADERGYSRIHTAVHPDNIAAKASIEARGGELQYFGYVFPV